jgi:hypothetical protein
MSENIEKFPLPLKEELPLDESPSPQSPGVVRHSGIVPWAHYPQGTTIIVIGGDGHLPTPPVPETLPAEEDDTYRMERRDLSYLSYILSSWQRAVIALANLSPEIPTFPALAQVWEMNSSANKKYIIYEHAGVEWRSSYHVKIENNKQKLIIHLANHGFLYFNPSDLEVISVTNVVTGVRRPRDGRCSRQVPRLTVSRKSWLISKHLRWPGLAPTRFASLSCTIRRAEKSIFVSNPRRMGLALSSAFKPTGLLQKNIGRIEFHFMRALGSTIHSTDYSLCSIW